MILICPVSGTENEDREECKQCGTDLRPLINVSSFPDQCFHEGVRCLEQGRLDEAGEKLSTAASLNPDSADIQWKLAELFSSQGLYQSAFGRYAQALNLAPERTDIREAHEALIQRQREKERATEQDANRRVSQRKRLRYIPIGAFLLGIVAIMATQSTVRWIRPRPDWAGIVQQRLSANAAIRSLNLKVSARNGRVLVAGEVPSELHRQLVNELTQRDVAASVDTNLLLVTPSPAVPAATYRVRRGDSWWTIARREYGIATVWPEIEKANQGRQTGPIRLNPGDLVVLPPVRIVPH